MFIAYVTIKEPKLTIKRIYLLEGFEDVDSAEFFLQKELCEDTSVRGPYRITEISETEGMGITCLTTD